MLKIIGHDLNENDAVLFGYFGNEEIFVHVDITNNNVFLVENLDDEELDINLDNNIIDEYISGQINC